MMLKQNIRVLGIDDGPFKREINKETCLTGVLMRMDGIIENVIVTYIKIDGKDSEDAILGFVNSIGSRNLSAIISEGITFGGFNIVDPVSINRKTGLPFISITKGEGNIKAMMAALEKHGDEEAVKLLLSLKPFKYELNDTQFTVNISGIERQDAIKLVQKLMRIGNVPEPVRIAHMISKALMRSDKMTTNNGKVLH